ncbi:MAG: hypothetical protein WBM32_06815 [Crocosphaera sp.]
MINTYLEKLLLTSGILYFNSLYFSILPLKVLAQNTVNITKKASLQLMIKGIKQPKLKCHVKNDQNTYFELSCDQGIETITDLEGDCYATTLEERWGKNCQTHTRISFIEDNSIISQEDFLILVNPDENEIEKTEGSSVCGYNNSLSMISKSENLEYEALIILEKQEYVNTPDCIEYLNNQGFI